MLRARTMADKREPWTECEVLVIDDDVGWQRSVRRILYDLEVGVVDCIATWDQIQGAVLMKYKRPVVLTELFFDGQPLGGLTIVEAARRLDVPVAVVTNAEPWRLSHLRAMPCLRKVDVSRATLSALLRSLDAGRQSAGLPSD